MYTVVGCGACDALWIVEGRPRTTGCPRCGTRHRFDRLRPLAEADDEDEARRARSVLLAERSGHDDAHDGPEAWGELGDAAEGAGVSDAEYLAGAGVDLDAVADAGERAGRGRGTGRPSRPAVVRDAVRELDSPTEDAVVAYAVGRGVPEEAARTLLGKLVRAGEVIESGGRHRLS